MVLSGPAETVITSYRLTGSNRLYWNGKGPYGHIEPMNPLRVLLLEDSAADAEPALHELCRSARRR